MNSKKYKIMKCSLLTKNIQTNKTFIIVKSSLLPSGQKTGGDDPK